MWPWTHAVFGYACASLANRAVFGRGPSDAPALVAVFAAVLPDLVDKPLAWTVGVVETGYGPAHSVLVGLPLVAAGAVWLWYSERPDVGLALGVGYLSHLLGDLGFQYVDEGELVLSVVLWPVAPSAPDSTGGVVEHVVFFFARYAADVRTGDAAMYLVATMLLALATVGLWVVDGMPVLRLLVKRR